ncbi:MAG: hypothetical protein JRJ69_11680 [Deltaproteobacteria bacterium]|nr:hypothetical protein [Deltaproteobacteria bacterium]MBW1738184.1 hypothetical protein [Deltaproteobacteria bacterium]MBW1910848.1 hypothetical protein [Deltaproteobacteria bacterium]MBW2035208.1 hypothetical protein [Deltaproteobacteria bacterium]MBW2114640.1 hypothetical protein [Deltaproteobacteria bacterium]
MKAAFTMIPAESKRLIAKAVVEMEDIKIAKQKAYIILNGGTTNGYIAQELLGMRELEPQKFAAGTNTHRLLCVTDPDKRTPFPIILYKGERSSKTLPEALQDFHIETVLIKGANAIDPEGNVGVITSGFDGGTIGATYGTATSQGLKYIFPVGREKMVPSVKEAAAWAGAKTLDYTIGADFGMFCIPNGIIVTEIEALKILADVDTKHIASGGIGESAGAVVLVIKGEDANVRKAISIVESIKGEPSLKGFKGTCETCRYACKFAGKKAEDLPVWLND